MKKSNCLKHLLYIAYLACFAFSCTKENEPEIIGKSTELTEYEKYVEDFNSGRIDSTTFILTQDGGTIYYSRGDEGQNFSVSKLDKLYNKEWEYSPGVTGEVIYLGRLIQIADGSIIFPVFKRNDLTNQIIQSIVKLNKNGKFLWERKVELDGALNFSEAIIYPTSDDGFIITSEFNHRNEYDIIVIKMDNIGNIEWSNPYGEAANSDMLNSVINAYDTPQCLIQTRDNGYLITFTTGLSDRNVNHLIKIDKYGSLINNTELHTWRMAKADLIESSDGGYMLITAYYPPEDSYPGQTVLSLFNINTSGNIIWSKEKFITLTGGIMELRILKLFNSGYYIIANDWGKCSMLKFNNSGDLIE